MSRGIQQVSCSHIGFHITFSANDAVILSSLRLFAKLTLLPCILITLTVPLFFLLNSIALPTPSENPCLLWLVALFFLLTILDTLQNTLYGPLLAMNESVTALSITTFTYGLLIAAIAAIIGNLSTDYQKHETKYQQVPVYATLPDPWTQFSLFIGLLIQTGLYILYVFRCNLQEKREEIVKRVELDRQRVVAVS